LSLVSLVDRIREGVPERVFIPGGEPWLLVGKRYLIPASAGTGKSLIALVVAVEVVSAGGQVSILDVENGADEYACRLGDVLDARLDAGVEAACADRLRYHDWPTLRTDWDPSEWAAALTGSDLVIFDSSRLLLSGAGLAEDSNDDYSTFVTALLTPLSRAGITTMVLDNTGHEERARARGASTKGDLNEVVYTVRRDEDFDRNRNGHVRLVRRRSRFADLPSDLRVPLGGGQYGPVEKADPMVADASLRPTTLMERVSRELEIHPGLSKRSIESAVRGKSSGIRLAIEILEAEGHLRAERDGQARRYHVELPFRQGAGSA
jgi:hypothetical protein